MAEQDETTAGGVGPDSRPAEMAAARLAALLAGPLAPGLYVVATPIGNLGDITLRALAVLACADTVYCEDTRHSRALFSAFGIGQRLRSYHEHNAAAERPRILAALAGGARIALISDAGTPLVSDPGYKLVREAIDAGFPVISVPGACAVLAALSSAGLPSEPDAGPATSAFSPGIPSKWRCRPGWWSTSRSWNPVASIVSAPATSSIASHLAAASSSTCG